MQSKEGYHYSVLFTRTEEQSKVLAILSEAFPKDRGKVFLPMLEYYRRDRGELAIKPLFPGYLFVHSDMDNWELYQFLLKNRWKSGSFIKELGLQKEKEQEPGYTEDGTGNEYDLADLTEEETAYLNQMLDDEGIERMSVGYRENNKLVIMEGPLTSYANHIVKVARHERLAYLNLTFRNIHIIAGLEIKPKREYFPEDQDTPAVLADGTEVDLLELKRRMMEG